MSEVKQLLDSLLWEIYGKQRQQQQQFTQTSCSYPNACMVHTSTMATKTRTSNVLNFFHRPRQLHLLSDRQLMDVCAILKVEIRLMSHCLERVLCMRERLYRHQEVLCEFVDAILHIEFGDDAHPKMHFSLSPPLPKADFTALTSATKNNIFNITNNKNITNNNISSKSNNINNFNNNNNYQLVTVTDDEKSVMSTDNEATSDYKQWLHAMKLVAHLPGGMPPEFRRKLWLSLADKYLKSKNIDWAKEEEKCFCEKWREDDEELGIQIVKDLHRTGSNLCTGPTGTINQAKLKRILLGYARYNPEVGYCQGFNMLGALILQVMDKNEFESMKVMIYLVEGVLPPGYFHGSMGGLQADMGVFRELMQTKLPRLAKHLQKLQGPVENAYEPPLTNVFTMQWFLTLFCTCLPMSCVLRVWDLVLIEGSDVLLRTALVLWGLLEDRVLSARTADDFYCKMGSFSGELLNGHLIDSNGLIEKVVILGPIPDIQRLRDKHLYNIAPLRNKPGLHSLYYDDEEGESDEESRLAVATVWGVPWGRRGSNDKQTPKQQAVESRDRIALDISLLKKQYDRLRERQKQAQLILTTACNTARQTASPVLSNSPNMPVNQLLMGRQAIITNRGKHIGAPSNLIPPARKPSLPAVLQSSRLPERQLKRGETLNWRDTDLTKQKRRDSLTWKEIKADRQSILQEGVATNTKQSQKLHSRLGKSDSSSYSEESGEEEDGSSTDTSLCDEDDIKSTDDKTLSSLEDSPKRRPKTPRRKKALLESLNNNKNNITKTVEKVRPKSWAPSTQEIPFILMSSDSPQHSGDEKFENEKETAESPTDDLITKNKSLDETDWTEFKCATNREDVIPFETAYIPIRKDIFKTVFELKLAESTESKADETTRKFNFNSNGITNQYFERLNSIERPKKLDLFYSLNEEDSIRNAYSDDDIKPISKFSSSEPNVPGKEAKECKTTLKNTEDLIMFEVNEQPKKLDLFYSLNEEDSIRNAYSDDDIKPISKFSSSEPNVPGKEAKEFKTTLINTEDLIRFEVKEQPKLKSSDHEIYMNSPDILKDTVRNKNVSVENVSKTFTSEVSDTESKKNTSLERLKNKRRDPRRMTLTRSSTIDIEERYKALEQSNIIGKYETKDKKHYRKSIPSTADLEERYNILERQLSGNGSKNRHQEIAENESHKTVSEKLFTSLSKQMSSTDLNATLKDTNDPKESTQKQNNSPTKQRGDAKQEHQGKGETESTTAQNQTSDVNPEEQRKVDEKPRLKKLPSTAELEDRFNALERRLSAQKSPLKAKKEPPDGSENSDHHTEDTYEQKLKIKERQDMSKCTEEKNVCNEQIEQAQEEEKTKNFKTGDNKVDVVKNDKIKDEPTAEKSERQQIHKHQNDYHYKEENSKNNINESNLQQTKKDNEGNSEEPKRELGEKTSPQNSIVKETQRKQEAESVEVKNSPENKPSNGRKSPPSTEELESRYRAIEKQLSVNRIEIEDQEIPAQKKSLETKKLSLEKHQMTTMPQESTPQAEALNRSNVKKENISTQKNSNEDTVKSNDCKKVQESSIDKKEKKAEHERRQLRAEKIIYGPNKRRGSEPPSTEDLEKRFENLKRRMSSRGIAEKTLTKAEMLAKYSHRTECDEIKESLEEDSFKKTDIHEPDQTNNKTSEILKQKENPQKLATTEDLENRFEALQLHAETKTPQKIDSYSEKSSTIKNHKVAKTRQIAKSKTECFDEEKSVVIPIAPPLPMSHNTEALNLIIPIESRRSLQRALVEELQSKIKTSPDGSNLKPSVINPNRKAPKIIRANQHKTIDGTSETHAKSAFSWSENHELWQPKKAVRRFSDLPSRADLENRLEFLERKLYQKFKKQRCASDSEVASMKSIGDETAKPIQLNQEMPSTSKAQPAPSNNLEERVQALEKQLSENSLKLVEAVRQITQEPISTEDLTLSRHVSTEFVDRTGKELVRYTNFGEMEDVETHKPLSINIHIKMSLKNKELENEKKSERLPSTEELERRLQILEQQIKESKLQELESGRAKKLEQNEHAKKEDILEKENNAWRMKTDERGHTADKEESIEKEGSVENTDDLEKNHKTESKNIKEDIILKKQEEVSNEKYNKNEITMQEIQSEKAEEKQRREIKMDQEKTPQKTPTVCTNENQNVKELPKKNEILQDNQEISKSEKKESSEEESKKIQPTTEDKKTLVECPEYVADNNATESVEEEKVRVTKNETSENEIKNEPKTTEKVVVDLSDVGNVDPNNKTVVLLMDNEPKAVKVRRLTRANTEELEGLFQALEKQLNDRNLIKSDDGKLVHALEINEKLRSESQKICNLTKEIEKLTNLEKVEMEASKQNEETKIEGKKVEAKKQEEPFDWGPDPVKRHLKRKTVYLPSTKELEARFRSFERQIKFLEDVEKIDVEQRLNEIERKIKLQYSLSHEKDLNKFLELCDGKEIDEPETTNYAKSIEEDRSRSPKNTRAQQQSRSPKNSPGRKSKRSPYQSPVRSRALESPYTSPARSNQQSPYTSPVRSKKHSPYTSPLRSQTFDDSHIPSTEDLEYRFRALELKRSSEHSDKSKKELILKKQPIHPLEMLLDPSPDDSNIPTTGELEHRMRILDEKRKTPTSPKASRSKSPKSPKYQRAVESPDMSPNYNRDLPTADELEARVRALEEDHCFDFKTQKTYKEFNQKLKDAISPSLSFEEFQANKSREQSPKRKSALRESEYDIRMANHVLRSTSPKTIRFAEDRDEFDEQPINLHGKTVGNSDKVIEMIEENSKILHRILKKTFTDSNSSIYSTLAAAEGLEARGARLLRETSPMRRTGTHTGVPLRTDLNINDRLDSIKNTIKSIDHLCEEKPYKKEKCQRYIDSLFTDSVHFTKKNSLEDLRRKDYGPSIRISDHCERPSGRTIGSAESIRSMSPLRAASPPHHRSNRELRREISPRRRRDEEREELESRVRRGNMLPKSCFLDNSTVSRDNSLTQFYKVDRQLDQYKYDDERYLSNSRSTSRSPLRSPYGSTDMMMHKTTITTNTTKTCPTINSRLDFDRPEEPYRTPSNNLSGYDFFKRPINTTPIYNPGKLEIRQTTVTSTFYDRLLAEKQIEKTLTRTPNKSPVVSPSITSKSYTDLAQASENIPLASPNNKSPTTLNNHFQLGHTSSIITTNSANISQAPKHHLPFSYTNPLPYTIASNITISSLTTQNQINGLPSFINSSLPSNTPNTSTTTTTNTTSILGNSVFNESTFNPISINNNNLISPSNNKNLYDGASASVNSTLISTGVYNPVMPFIMRQPQDAATITSLNVLEQNLSNTTTSITPNKVNGNLPKL